MAILDERTEFADATAITGTAAATAIAGDVIDLGDSPTLQDIGNGRQMYLVIQVDTQVAASGGAANVTFKLVSDSTANLTTSPTTHINSGAIAKATLAPGYQLVYPLPLGKVYERYLGVTFTPDTNDTTAGKINAFLTLDPPVNSVYPAGITS